MSVVSLPKEGAAPTVPLSTLRKIEAYHGIRIPPQDEIDYHILLNSLDSLIDQVNAIPEYEDPRLKPKDGTVDAKGGREYWKVKENENKFNAWSHKCAVSSPSVVNGPLSGKTVALKDNTSVFGLPLTAGTFPQLLSSDSKYPISTIDASVVSRFLEAGATVKGTATCENFSFSPLSFTSANGKVSNPWLPEGNYTVGGSSSGSTVLVAISVIKDWRKKHGIKGDDNGIEMLEGVDMALGGDQGGSIRIPAAYTGIYGLKATHGLIPYTGVVSLHPMLDHCGPMTKNLDDLALALGVLAGYDGIDPRMGPEAPLKMNVRDYKKLLDEWVAGKRKNGEWSKETAGKGLKIGVLREAFEVPGLSDRMSSLVKKAIARFETLGATVKEVSVPMHHSGGPLWTVASRAQIPLLAFDNMPSPLLSHPLPNLNPPPMNQEFYDLLTRHNPAPVNVALNATYMNKFRPDAALITAKSHMHVHQLRAAYDVALEDCDVFVTPVNPRVGVKLPSLDDSVLKKTTAALGATLNTAPFNLTGHPGLAMPIGFGETEDGDGKLPVGMQIVGKRWDEETILKVAAAWEVGGLGLDEDFD